MDKTGMICQTFKRRLAQLQAELDKVHDDAHRRRVRGAIWKLQQVLRLNRC